MTKRKNSLTEEKISRMESEGRGKGQGKMYKPWITIQDFPSQGLSSRTMGWKTNRIHHFLSKLELHYFYVLEWDSAVIDIREQYPLIREDTHHIALKKSIKHPIDPKTNVPIVMTTDFLITVDTPSGSKLFARTVKPASELENKRVIEKFEIERTYWENHGVDWGIVTEKEIPADLIANVEWLHLDYYPFEDFSTPAFQYYIQSMKSSIRQTNTTLIEFVSNFDCNYHLDPGTGLSLFKNLAARKEIELNISKKIHTHLLVKDILSRT